MKTCLFVILYLSSSLISYSQYWQNKDAETLIPGTIIYQTKDLKKLKSVISKKTEAIVFESDSTDYYGVIYKQKGIARRGFIFKHDLPKGTISVISNKILAFYTPDLHSQYQYPTSLELVGNDKIIELKKFSSMRSYVNSRLTIKKISAHGNEFELIELYFHDFDTCSVNYSYIYYKLDGDNLTELVEFNFNKDESSSPTYKPQFPSDPYGKENKLVWLKIEFIYNDKMPFGLKKKIFFVAEEIDL